MLPKDLPAMIAKLETLDDVNAASRLLKERWRTMQVQAGGQFSPGDQVEFMARGTLHKGLVTRVNTKSVGVAVGGRQWKVSPSLLRKG